MTDDELMGLEEESLGPGTRAYTMGCQKIATGERFVAAGFFIDGKLNGKPAVLTPDQAREMAANLVELANLQDAAAMRGDA